jgi:hypothetical protein
MAGYLHCGQHAQHCFRCSNSRLPVGLPDFSELVDRLPGVKYRNKIEIIFLRSLIGVELLEN